MKVYIVILTPDDKSEDSDVTLVDVANPSTPQALIDAIDRASKSRHKFDYIHLTDIQGYVCPITLPAQLPIEGSVTLLWS